MVRLSSCADLMICFPRLTKQAWGSHTQGTRSHRCDRLLGRPGRPESQDPEKGELINQERSQEGKEVALD